jgi:putative serine/threonine protein kinase
MSNGNEIALENVLGTKYARFITYPSPEAKEAKDRVEQLAALGITRLTFRGPTLIDGVQIMGKGCVGIVLQALCEQIPVAVKIRRTDADRTTLLDEARLLRLANSVNVGPTLIRATRNFLIMQLFDGLPLYLWAQRTRKPSLARRVLRQLLIECFKLDAIGLDHGELSHAPKNVLVNSRNTPCIVDFESASSSRRAANVTSLIQYFLFGQLAREIGTPRLYHDRKSILKALTTYKQDGSVLNFNNVLQALSLKP